MEDKYSLNITDDNFEEESTSEELYENYKIIVDKGQSLLRIDKFLMVRIENVSRNKIQKAADNNCIKVNGKAVKSNYRVKPLDVIQVFLTSEPKDIEIIAQNIPIDIVYEDDDLIIVNKPSGMVVHPAYGNYDGTLVNALEYHLNKNLIENNVANYKEHKDHKQALLVHRIDKNTTGLLVVAKNERAQTLLAEQFFYHTIDRMYTALVWGDLAEETGTIDKNVARDSKDRKIMATYDDETIGKHAVTHWKVLERFGYITLIQCKLETGRTHQIRVHMKSIGHPLFNDDTYGGDRILKGTTFTKYKQFVTNCFDILPRQALHATTLGFIHPTTNEKVFFSSALPEDMTAVIEKWRSYSSFNKQEK